MNEKEKPMLEYNIFQKVILDFQLRSHEKFLKNFVTLFRTVDKDINGIIDEVRSVGRIHDFNASRVSLKRWWALWTSTIYRQMLTNCSWSWIRIIISR